MTRTTQRVGPRDGYDRWSRTYDATVSSLVALDRRETLEILDPRPGDRILDAGCGTGSHLRALEQAGAWAVGLDFSAGMLGVARAGGLCSKLILADLNHHLPLAPARFDAVLCTLVSEHLSDISEFLAQTQLVLRPGGRLVFSAFHPDLAAEGIEANFAQGGVEYRLGAELYSVEEYLAGVGSAGFESIVWQEFECDDVLVGKDPSAAKHLGKKMLLLIEARRPHETRR